MRALDEAMCVERNGHRLLLMAVHNSRDSPLLAHLCRVLGACVFPNFCLQNQCLAHNHLFLLYLPARAHILLNMLLTDSFLCVRIIASPSIAATLNTLIHRSFFASSVNGIVSVTTTYSTGVFASLSSACPANTPCVAPDR